MSRMCQVCGGLIPAPNEVLGYSGPMCSGLHQQYFGNVFQPPGYQELRIAELEQRVFDLTQRLSQQSATKPKAPKSTNDKEEKK